MQSIRELVEAAKVAGRMFPSVQPVDTLKMAASTLVRNTKTVAVHLSSIN